jgi:hypothetical protein
MVPKLIDTYVKLVKSGKMTIDEVPERYREAVRKALED